MWRTVFTAPYMALAAAIAAGMAFGLLLLSEYLFLEPYVVGHIPPGTEPGFLLILGIAAMSGLVIPMNIYRIRLARQARAMGGGVAGSLIGAAAGACGCGPAGFAVISTFGSAGAAASSFLANYDVPVRMAALAVLCITMYTTVRALNAQCRISR